jgi:hypothetical protein
MSSIFALNSPVLVTCYVYTPYLRSRKRSCLPLLSKAPSSFLFSCNTTLPDSSSSPSIISSSSGRPYLLHQPNLPAHSYTGVILTFLPQADLAWYNHDHLVPPSNLCGKYFLELQTCFPIHHTHHCFAVVCRLNYSSPFTIIQTSFTYFPSLGLPLSHLPPSTHITFHHLNICPPSTITRPPSATSLS